MWAKLKAWLKSFVKAVVTPVLKIAGALALAIFIVTMVRFGSATIVSVPAAGLKPFIGQRVYQTWLKGVPLYLPWNVQTVGTNPVK